MKGNIWKSIFGA